MMKAAAEKKELKKFTLVQLRSFLHDKGMTATGNKHTLMSTINDYFSL